MDKKDGFTLIELLVVITIMGILAYFVLADYNGEIRRNRVRVAQETVYAELQDLRVKVVSGNYYEEEIDLGGAFEESEIFYCRGLEISFEDGFRRVFTRYDADSGCDYGNIEDDGDLQIGEVGLLAVNDEAEGDYYVFFEPPNGDMNISGGVDALEVVMGYAGYEKTINLNSLTGSIDLGEQETE